MRKQHRIQEEKGNKKGNENGNGNGGEQTSEWRSTGRRCCQGRRSERKGDRKVAGFWLGMLLVFLFAFAGTLGMLITDERCAQISGQPAALERAADLLEGVGERIELRFGRT